MAKAEIIIPFVFHFAAGVCGSDLSLPLVEQFEIARRGGWSDDPDDPGGATMIDVTLATYRTFRRKKNLPEPSKADLRQISFPEWKDILKTMFWDRLHADDINSQGVANILFDWLWASGPSAIRNIQKILGVKSDGIIGPITLLAINSRDHSALFHEIREVRERHYRSCRGAWKYLNGWLRRLNALRSDGSFRL